MRTDITTNVYHTSLAKTDREYKQNMLNTDFDRWNILFGATNPFRTILRSAKITEYSSIHAYCNNT